MPQAASNRLLFIDAYDSFTNNIVSLLETRLEVAVTVIKIDDAVEKFPAFLKPFAAVVAGPGPGDPRNPKDVGLIGELWRLRDKDVLPVLGVCLGFQSLVHHFGGKIDRLPEPRHGIVRKVKPNGASMFDSISELETVQYHSLYASLPSINDTGEVQEWGPDEKSPTLNPLAWDCELDNLSIDLSDALQPSMPRVLMAVEHTSRPFFGVQFHAESICSNESAREVMDAWWGKALAWNKNHRVCDPPVNGYPTPPQEAMEDAGLPAEISLDEAQESQPVKYRRTSNRSRGALHSVNHNAHEAKLPLSTRPSPHNLNSGAVPRSKQKVQKTHVIAEAIDVCELTIPSICETLELTEGDCILLDSELHQRPEVGEISIIGLVSPDSIRFEYNVGLSKVRQICDGITTNVQLDDFGGNVLSYLKAFMKDHQSTSHAPEIPFWGGLMGYINYEACLETIGVSELPDNIQEEASRRPDLSFVFVERSIVLNHSTRKLYVQSVKPNYEQWVSNTASLLQEITTRSAPSNDALPTPLLSIVTLPSESIYKSQVRACQQSIRAGDSYELCLTTQATIKTHSRQPSWPLYQRLRKLNSSPFSAYLRFGKLSLLSSSPERFLRWSRPARRKEDNDTKTVTCQFRPIKGTVKRQPNPTKPPLTLAQATALLSTPKERAENLMIVDLIRHDLHGVVGSGNVTVPKLMVVEEYATLFQLVSVIEGTLAIDDCEDENDENDHRQHAFAPDTCRAWLQDKAPRYSSLSNEISGSGRSGIDILSSSLPPGSMTGAPKLRSCQLLRALENRKRGVYSGIVGYMDVGGGGDFSVVIRSAVRWDDDASDGNESEDGERHRGEHRDENGGGQGDEWTIGAGGAVTAMSTEEGEWEEMVAKLRSTMRLFEDGS